MVVTHDDVRRDVVAGHDAAAGRGRDLRFRLFDRNLPRAVRIADHRLADENRSLGRADEVEIVRQRGDILKSRPGLSQKPVIERDVALTDARNVAVGDPLVAAVGHLKIKLDETADIVPAAVGVDGEDETCLARVEVEVSPVAFAAHGNERRNVKVPANAAGRQLAAGEIRNGRVQFDIALERERRVARTEADGLGAFRRRGRRLGSLRADAAGRVEFGQDNAGFGHNNAGAGGRAARGPIDRGARQSTAARPIAAGAIRRAAGLRLRHKRDRLPHARRVARA